MQWGSLRYSKRLDAVLRSPCRLTSCAEKALKVRRGLGERRGFAIFLYDTFCPASIPLSAEHQQFIQSSMDRLELIEYKESLLL